MTDLIQLTLTKQEAEDLLEAIEDARNWVSYGDSEPFALQARVRERYDKLNQLDTKVYDALAREGIQL